MPLSSCDDDRLALAEKAQASLTEGRELVKSGDYAQALECYLFAFDNSLAVNGWGGVRLSYIPAEIARLGDKYPPAKLALKVRRDAREAMVRAGETDYDIVAEWTSINRYLHEQDRELLLLKELDKNGTLSDSLKKKIVDENFDRLLQEKKYRLLGEYFNDFGQHFLRRIAHYEETILFPERYSVRQEPSHVEYLKQTIAKEGAKIFELALALGRIEQSDAILERILRHCNDSQSFDLLINAATRAGKKRKTRELSKLAAMARLNPAGDTVHQEL